MTILKERTFLCPNCGKFYINSEDEPCYDEYEYDILNRTLNGYPKCGTENLKVKESNYD